MKKTIQLTVNHKKVIIEAGPDRSLLWALRTEMGLTGVKYGCGEGYCGACTVLVDQEPVRACQNSLKDVAGKEIITIEGLSRNGKLHPLQEAFIRQEALQCGYCTPAMILNAHGLLLKNPHPSRKEVIDHMDDHLCRCGSYNRIIEAILSAGGKNKAG